MRMPTEVSSEHDRLSGESWPSILLVYLFAVVAGASIGKMIPLISVIAAETGVRLETASWLISCISLASILAGPSGGTMADRLGDRRMIAIGIVIMIAANFLNWLSRDFISLLLSRMVEGLGFFLLSLGATTMMVRTAGPKRRAFAMSLMSTSVPLGVGLSIALAGQISGVHWRMIFLLHIAILGIMLALVWLSPRWVAPAGHDQHQQYGWGTVLRAPGLAWLSMGILIATIAMFGLGALFPTYATQAFGMTMADTALVGLIAYPASIVGSFIVGFLPSGVTGNRFLLLIMTLLAVTGAAAFLPVLGIAASVVLLSLFYILGGMVGAFGMTRLPGLAPAPSALGRSTGLYILASNFGMLIGAPIVFGTYAMGGSTGMICLIALCAAATLFLWRKIQS